MKNNLFYHQSLVGNICLIEAQRPDVVIHAVGYEWRGRTAGTSHGLTNESEGVKGEQGSKQPGLLQAMSTKAGSARTFVAQLEFGLLARVLWYSSQSQPQKGMHGKLTCIPLSFCDMVISADSTRACTCRDSPEVILVRHSSLKCYFLSEVSCISPHGWSFTGLSERLPER